MNLILNIKKHWLIIVIMLTGITFRFLPLFDYEFSHDELSGLSRTVYPNFFDELYYGIKIDAHPALIQLFLWFWVKWFGYNEVFIKLPFLLCGVLSIWYIYRFAVLFFNKNVGYISASIISLSFIFIVYSSYARMYIPGVLFSILLLISLFKIIFSQHVKTRDYFFFSLFAALCAYNHHMSSLFAFVCVGLSFFYINKVRLKKYIIFCSLAILLYLPHLSITLYQLSIGGIGAQVGGWLPPPRINEIYFFIKTLFGCGSSGLMIMIVFALVSIFTIVKNKRITKKQSLLFWIFTINYVIIHLYSVYKNPILQNSCLLFSGITLILLASSFFQYLNNKYIFAFICFLFISFTFQNLRKKHLFSKVHVHEFEQQSRIYLDIVAKFGKNSATGIFASEEFFVDVYEKKYNKSFNHITIYDNAYDSITKLRSYLSSLKQPYIVLGGINAATTQLIKEYYPYLYLHKEDYFSNVLVLSKTKQLNDDVSIIQNQTTLNSAFNIFINNERPLIFYKDSMYYSLTKKDLEYPFSVGTSLKKIELQQNQSLVIELSYKTDSIINIADDKLCLSISEKESNSAFYKSENLKDYFHLGKKTHTLYLELFAGSDFPTWIKRNMNVSIFIDKNKKSHYDIVNFKVKIIDYSPTRWTLWD
jgi:uncharacterized membrane protein